MYEFTIHQQYILFPVRTGAPKQHLALDVAGKTVREFDIEFAADDPEFKVFLDVSAFAGQTAALRAVEGDASGLERIAFADALPDAACPYEEETRPQFHFTSRRGWLNDPNGLVYADGVWHLYYQHNPYGWNWGNMHWGHATSPDLVHWQEQGIALYPKQYGDWAYSGSGFVLPDGRLAIAYTSTGRGECLAISDDGGKTFAETPESPVVRHRGRDPKVFRHEESGHWVMAVYDETDDQRTIAIHTSPDLREWTFASSIPGFYECPELFPLALDGDPGRVQWVLYGADGEYLLGDFDGREFRPTAERQLLWYGNFYASQTYTDAPDDRRIQIGWGRGIEFPGMPFNQQMGIATELSLVTTSTGPALVAAPVQELESIREPALPCQPAANTPVLIEQAGELLDIEAVLRVPDGQSGGLVVRGVSITWDRQANTLQVADIAAPLPAGTAPLDLRVLVDRGSVEVFAVGGRIAIAKGVRPAVDSQTVSVEGDQTVVDGLLVHPLRSVWSTSAG